MINMVLTYYWNRTKIIDLRLSSFYVFYYIVNLQVFVLVSNKLYFRMFN